MEFNYGPLNKSLFTQELELLVKCLLYVPEQIVFKIHQEVNGESVHAHINSLDINVSSLLARANFSHLLLTEADSEQYLKTINEPYRLEETIEGLTLAENQAIKAYTGSFYYNLNAFLYGKLNNLYTYYSEPSYLFKDLLINAVFLGSGLNKILPSLEYSDNPSYRGEHSTPDSEIAYRIELIEEGGGVTDQKAYMSTSSDVEIGEMFKGNCLIIFDSIYGKEISGISDFPSEQEFLLSPGQIFWESYEYENDNIIFHAKVVSPLIDGKDDVMPQDIHLFNELLTWAKAQDVPVDFLTPYLENELAHESNVLDVFTPPQTPSISDVDTKGEMITLEDVLICDNESIDFTTQDLVSHQEIALPEPPSDDVVPQNVMITSLNMVPEIVEMQLQAIF
ncbi:MAG: hypothetical protein BGO43_15120 [Gammaproteobacteria bacterium 39-13]|nr:hypothetical protein [Gammaproteobacteria bacterium]OJV87748.1 MAG: hypothetical protein BGO43_15120 [Gammaproteobacteria bacterium 39-13]